MLDLSRAEIEAAVDLDRAFIALEEGFKADITLFDMNSAAWYPRHDLLSLLVYSANSSSVDSVMINGKMVMEKGHLLTLDEERILYEANRCAVALTK